MASRNNSNNNGNENNKRFAIAEGKDKKVKTDIKLTKNNLVVAIKKEENVNTIIEELETLNEKSQKNKKWS